MPAKKPPLSRKWLLLSALGAAVCYHLAMLWQPVAGWLVLGYLAFLWQLRRAATARAGFYFGWMVGLCIMVPQTWFVYGIFKHLGILLWLLMSIWLGLLVAMWQAGAHRWGDRIMTVLAPVLMLGVEFFRSEIWPLRFTWDTAGFALPAVEWKSALWALGIYGTGALLLGLVTVATSKVRMAAVACIPLGILLIGKLLPSGNNSSSESVAVAGLQWEDGSSDLYLKWLDQSLLKHPATQLFVFSEYSFPGPPPPEITEWARIHGRYVITCGADIVPGATFDKYYNTAFVIGSDGSVVHRQVKAVPIQFMDDGLPAPRQAVWPSPWGKLGICICYDMNYTTVTDELVRQGARALVIPAMDRENWGAAEHVLSARLGATRAAEYGLPVFRLASSGISQIIQSDGTIAAAGEFPGQGDTVAGELALGSPGHLPLDRWLAWPCVVVAGIVLLWLIVGDLHRRITRQ